MMSLKAISDASFNTSRVNPLLPVIKQWSAETQILNMTDVLQIIVKSRTQTWQNGERNYLMYLYFF